MENIVAYAKRLLKQRWSAEPVSNHLRRKGWHLLPSGSWVMARNVAYS